MVVKPDQERVKTLLKDTITLLCKNGLSFTSKFSIEAVIGVTLDENDVFLMSINELVKVEGAIAGTDTSREQVPSLESGGSHLQKRRRKRRMHGRAANDVHGTSERESSSSEPEAKEPSDIEAKAPNQSSSDEPPSKRQTEVGSAEFEDGDSSSRDVVYIKEEPSESWPQQTGSSRPPDDLPDFSTANFSQEPSFPMLPSSALRGAMSQSVWSGLESSQSAGVGTSSWASGGGPDQEGDASQSLDNSQVMPKSAANRPCVCDICFKTFTSRTILQRHKKNHMGIYNYYCEVCGKGFTSAANRSGHMSVHTGVRDFKCQLCDREFAYKYHLKSHLKRIHGTDLI